MTEASVPGGRGRRIGLVAVVLALSVAASRVLGLVRESVFAGLVGMGPEADAYRSAFTIPDTLNHLLAGGALSVAFIPFYTRYLREGGPGAAARVFEIVLGALGGVVVLATAGLWLLAEPVVYVFFGVRGGYPPELLERIVYLVRILLPAQIFFVVGGVLRGVLMAHDRFASQAAAGVVYNLGIIFGGLVAGEGAGADGFAWGALAGAFLGPFLFAVVELVRSGFLRLRFRIEPRSPELREYLLLAAPLLIGFGMLTVDDIYNKFFGARLGSAGAVASIGVARQLMLTPVGIIGQSIATAALPTLAALWTQRRQQELDAMVQSTLQAGLGLALLASAALFVLAEPAVILLFERGRFTAQDSAVVIGLVRVFAFAIPGWVIAQVAPRPFYAREDMWRPMIASTLVAGFMAPLYWSLGERWGAQGLAAAGAAGMALNALVLLELARRLHGAPNLAVLGTSGLRSLVIALLTASGGLLLPLPDLGGIWGLVGELAARGAWMGALALLGVRLLGDAPTRRALDRILRRLTRRSRRVEASPPAR